MTIQDVAVIGVGAMGAPMAMNIHKAGFNLTVCDQSPDARKPFSEIGARCTESAADCADCDAVIILVATPDQAPCYVFTVNVQCDYHDEIAANGLVRGFVRYNRLGRSSAEVAFLLQSDSDSRVLASGKITQVFVDPATRQSIPIPDFFRTNILARQPELVDPE